MPDRTSRTTPRPSPTRHVARARPAPPEDQLDALVGMLLEAAAIQHQIMGGEARTFDYDAARDRLYRIARSRGSTTALRYRALARRGLGSPAAPHRGDRDGDEGARRRLPRPEPCLADEPPY